MCSEINHKNGKDNQSECVTSSLSNKKIKRLMKGKMCDFWIHITERSNL